MFLLFAIALAPQAGLIQSGNNNLDILTSKANKLKERLIYKAIRKGEQNHLAQRVGIEALGVDFPTIVSEFFLRGYKSALGAGVRISLFICNSLIIPALIVPVLNFIAAKKFDIPKAFTKPFLNQFSDLTPESKNEESNTAFVENLMKSEKPEAIKSEFHEGDGKIKHNAVNDFKEKMLEAKSFVMKWDVQISGLLTYIVPWTQNWFEQKILGLIGFSGEDKFLEDSQKEESMGFHNRFKHYKLAAGILPTVLGSHYFSKTVHDSVNATDNEVKDSKIKSFIKTHIKQFDYHEGIYANKLNLTGIVFFGGDTGMLLAARTIGEVFERVVRLSAFWPSFVYGIEWLHSKFASNSDKKSGTKLIDESEQAELGIKKVKPLVTLENEFDIAIKNENEIEANRALKSMENGVGAFGKAFLGNSAFLGVILNIISYVFMRVRIAKGIY